MSSRTCKKRQDAKMSKDTPTSGLDISDKWTVKRNPVVCAILVCLSLMFVGAVIGAIIYSVYFQPAHKSSELASRSDTMGNDLSSLNLVLTTTIAVPASVISAAAIPTESPTTVSITTTATQTSIHSVTTSLTKTNTKNDTSTTTFTVPGNTVTLTAIEVSSGKSTSASGLCFWAAQDILTPCTSAVAATAATSSKTSAATLTASNPFEVTQRLRKVMACTYSSTRRTLRSILNPIAVFFGRSFNKGLEDCTKILTDADDYVLPFSKVLNLYLQAVCYLLGYMVTNGLFFFLTFPEV